MPYIALTYWDVALASVFILINGSLSILLQLGIHRRLFVAALRMLLQLSLVVLMLTALFSSESAWWTAVAVVGMALFAGKEITARQDRPLSGWWSYGIGTGCMMTGSLLATVFALTTVLRPHPWYSARYAIPLLGMILGNAMTGIALGIQGLTTGLVTQRSAVEAQLMLGATRRMAMGPVIRLALRNALMPIINSMSVTGVVSLPGMMTGQILGGVAPAEAVKYQILIMFLIAGSTGIGAIGAVMATGYRLSDSRHRLRLDRLSVSRS